MLLTILHYPLVIGLGGLVFAIMEVRCTLFYFASIVQYFIILI